MVDFSQRGYSLESFQICPNCGKKTPEENLRCIFCSEMLPVNSGTIGSFRFGPGRVLFLSVSLFLLFLFFWFYVR